MQGMEDASKSMTGNKEDSVTQGLKERGDQVSYVTPDFLDCLDGHISFQAILALLIKYKTSRIHFVMFYLV